MVGPKIRCQRCRSLDHTMALDHLIYCTVFIDKDEDQNKNGEFTTATVIMALWIFRKAHRMTVGLVAHFVFILFFYFLKRGTPHQGTKALKLAAQGQSLFLVASESETIPLAATRWSPRLWSFSTRLKLNTLLFPESAATLYPSPASAPRAPAPEPFATFLARGMEGAGSGMGPALGRFGIQAEIPRCWMRLTRPRWGGGVLALRERDGLENELRRWGMGGVCVTCSQLPPAGRPWAEKLWTQKGHTI